MSYEIYIAFYLFYWNCLFVYFFSECAWVWWSIINIKQNKTKHGSVYHLGKRVLLIPVTMDGAGLHLNLCDAPRDKTSNNNKKNFILQDGSNYGIVRES